MELKFAYLCRFIRKVMKNLKLTAVYTPCEEGGFMAQIVEIQGVISQGETLDEAKINLMEALELMLETIRWEKSQELTNQSAISQELLFSA